MLAEVEQPWKLNAVLRPRPSPRHRVLREIQGQWQLKKSRPPTQSKCHHVLVEIEGRRALKKPTNRPSHVSQSWARVLQEILKLPKPKPLEHPKSSSYHEIITKQKQTREGQTKQTFFSRNSREPIVAYDCQKGECSMNGVVKRDEKRQRVLAVDAATEGESIEKMVSRLERDLDKEFGCFG